MLMRPGYFAIAKWLSQIAFCSSKFQIGVADFLIVWQEHHSGWKGMVAAATFSFPLLLDFPALSSSSAFLHSSRKVI